MHTPDLLRGSFLTQGKAGDARRYVASNSYSLSGGCHCGVFCYTGVQMFS